jgi:hypothetical protein
LGLNIAFTMDLYSHLIDGMEKPAAEKINWTFAATRRGKEFVSQNPKSAQHKRQKKPRTEGLAQITSRFRHE